MFGFLNNLIPKSLRGESTDSSTRESSGPSINRPEIIEGSVKPTYFNPDAVVKREVARLHVLGVEIVYGDEQDGNLVADLRKGFRGGQFPQLTQVNQHLVSHTLNRLAKLGDDKLKNQKFILGEVETAELLSSSDMKSFVKALTLQYPGYADLVAEFDSTAIVGANLSNRTITQDDLEALVAPRLNSIGSEPDARSRFDLLKIVTDAFDTIGEPVSFGRLKFLNSYVPALAQCPEDRRCEIIRKIFSEEYPFNRENQASWDAEIGSSMSAGGSG